MIAWIYILIPSAITGLISAWLINGKKALLFSALIPWLGVLLWLLYNEYFIPYQGGGASMWLVAQVFAGSAAAATGFVVCLVIQKQFRRIA